MTPAQKSMHHWLSVATPAQKRQLAKWAKTSVTHLGHLGAGRRGATADLAQRLSVASQRFKDPKLLIDQRALCSACEHCPLLNDPLTQ